MKPYAEKFYKGNQWIRCRNAYFKTRHGLCERCGCAGVVVHHKEHITPLNIDNPLITLNWGNLEVLCQDCHNKEHHGSKEEVVRVGMMFDDTGNLIAISPP